MMRKKSCGMIAAALGAVTALSSGALHAATYQQTIINDAPIRYYRLGESGGPTAFDSMGIGNGTYNNFSVGDFNQPGALIGNTNGSANFDGVDNTVSAPHAADLNLTGNMTVEFWMNKNSESLNGDWARLVGKGDQLTRTFGIWEEAGAGQRILFQQYNGTGGAVLNFFSNGTVPIGAWTHVVATINGSNAAIYLNGVLDATSTRVGAVGTDAAPLTIGRASDIHTYFPGRLDEVAIYNKALNQVQVYNHYLVGTNQAPVNIQSEVLGDNAVAYYRHDDGGFGSQPLVMVDSAAPAQNGTYFNGVTMVQGLPTQFGPAAGFDGVNDYARIDASTITPFTSGAVNAFSFETWFNTTSGGVILGQTGAGSTPGVGGAAGWVPALYVDTAGLVRAQTFWQNTGVSPIASPTAYNDGQWHHVVTTFDAAGTQRLFIDGVLVASAAGRTQASYAAAYDFYLGTGYTAGAWPSGNGGWYFFNGRLDETAIYHSALSPEDVMRHYIAGLTAPTPEPATASLALLGVLALGRRGRRMA